MSNTDWPTLAGISFGPKPCLDSKVYPFFIKGTTCSEHPTVLMVRLDWLAGALRGDGVWADTHADRRSQTFKPERYETVLRQVQTDAPIHMPWLYFDKGRTTIMDGRHRLYVLIDLGYTHVPVLVDPDYVAPIATLVDPDFVGKFG